MFIDEPGKRFVRYVIAVCFALASTAASANPDIQSWTTKQGARIMLIENHALPMLDIRVIFDAGSARDGDRSGLALLTNSLLDEGAGGLSAQQLAVGLESVGASVDLDSLRDMSYVGLRTLSGERYQSKAIAMFRKVLSQPDFPQKAFDRQLARFKVSVEAREQSPSDIAEETFYEELYGDHPYATPISGTRESLAMIERKHVVAHYTKYYVAANANVAIVGDIDRQQAERLVESLMSGLEKGEKAAAIPEVKMLDKAKTVYVDYPSKQSHIYIGQPAMARGDEDYFDLYVANHPFGGSGFASRLVEVIREKRGLAYSVYSYFSPMREAGPFMMGMQTKNDQVDEAIKLLNAELDKYIEEGTEDQELKDSISNITGSFPLNLDSNSKMLGYLAMMGFYGMSDDYLDTFLGKVRAVSKGSAKQAFAKLIDTDRLVTVVVGQRESAED